MEACDSGATNCALLGGSDQRPKRVPQVAQVNPSERKLVTSISGMALARILPLRGVMERAMPPTHEAQAWTMHRICPIEWDSYIERCGGGFFHTLAGLHVLAREGELRFIELRRGQEVIGVAAGILSACRLSTQPRHVYLPTPPALLVEDRNEANGGLVETLRLSGAAEVIIDSFDATWCPNASKALIVNRRREYIVSLAGGVEGLGTRCGTLHRRGIRRGDRAGWSLRMLQTTEAATLLLSIHKTTLEARPADQDSGELPVGLAQLAINLRASSGVAVFSAWDGTVPLGAALVGWANGKACFVLGGSTPKGHSLSSAVWLHWRIMCMLSAAGFTVYNLGGTAVPVADKEEGVNPPSRFERDFGAESVECDSVRWILHVGHARAHELGGRMSGSRSR